MLSQAIMLYLKAIFINIYLAVFGFNSSTYNIRIEDKIEIKKEAVFKFLPTSQYYEKPTEEIKI